MIAAGCAAAVAVVLALGTPASADRELGPAGTRVTGESDNKEWGPETRCELGPETREQRPSGIEY
jgi:hypothetical protein